MVASSAALIGKRSRSPSLEALPIPAKCAARERDRDRDQHRDHHRDAPADGDNISECTLYCASPVPSLSPSCSPSPSVTFAASQVAAHSAAPFVAKDASEPATQAGAAVQVPTSSPDLHSTHATTVTANPRVALTADLPDEVLVSVLRFVRSARALARLRAVCKRWRGVIDSHPAVWRNASFSGAVFSQPVVIAAGGAAPGAGKKRGGPTDRVPLALGPRAGHVAVALAADAGNEWAQFLRAAVFDRAPLRAVTLSQPAATLLVSGVNRSVTRGFPPWGDGDPPKCARNGRTGSWVAVHAGRTISPDLAGFPMPQFVLAMPRGALVGMVYVSKAWVVRAAGVLSGEPEWYWKIDRHVQLVKPMRCGGFVGLWTLSEYMTEYFVRALHSQ